MARRRMCDVAEEWLRETGNPAIVWGDGGFCEIAKRAGSVRRVPFQTRGGHVIADHPLAIAKRVLDALSRQPGNLVPGKVSLRGYSSGFAEYGRIFYLPEHAPKETA